MTEKSVSLLGKIAGFTEILAKDPQSTVFVSLSEAYRQLGMLDDALEIAEKGTRNLPGFSPGFVSLGRIHAQQGDLALAANSFEKALAIEKDSLAALKGLARARYRQGYLDKARELLLHARQLNAEDPLVLKMLSSLGPEVDNVDSTLPAEPDLQESLEKDSTAPREINADVAMDEEGAGSSNADALEDTKPLQTTTLAQLYFKQGLLDEAARIYREILREDPHNEDVRSRLVQIKQTQAESGTEGQVALQPEVEPQAREPEPLQDEPGDELDVFQRWLTAIEDRRAHVC